MGCLLPNALSKSSACCAPKKLMQFVKVRHMEFCLMNRTETAVGCYRVHHVTAETKRKISQDGNINQRNSNQNLSVQTIILNDFGSVRLRLL